MVTLILICIGGVVTSTGSGLAVPDWPTSYGYNMFLFPFSRWFGDTGIFYEHTHRVVASGLGFMMIGLCAWLWGSGERMRRKWLCWAGTGALGLVIVQGVLGGLRVTELNNFLGLIHACVAQAFLVLVALIALSLSKTWMCGFHKGVMGRFTHAMRDSGLRVFALILTFLVLTQLILGASMRHQHNGLAVEDFPLAYGQLWPKTGEREMQIINLSRVESHQMPVTGAQIHLHMTHRVMACILTVLVGIFVYRLIRQNQSNLLGKLFAWIIFLTLLAQFTLGAWTVLSNKAADIATAHVFGGAVLLLELGLLTALLYRAHAQKSPALADAGSPLSSSKRQDELLVTGQNA